MAFTNTASALRTYGGLIASRLSQGLKDSNSDASGKLDESIKFKVSSKSNKLTMDLSMLDYYEFVDEGRKPGRMPPTRPILEWLSYPNVKDKVGVSGLEDSKLQGLAFAIAKKIGREGTKGTNFYTNVINSRLVTQDLDKAVTNAISEDIDEAMKLAFDDID